MLVGDRYGILGLALFEDTKTKKQRMATEDDSELQQLREALDNATTQLQFAQQLLHKIEGADSPDKWKKSATTLAEPSIQGNQQILEGVFNGQNMVGADGKIYTVPANYASKSKLVEGDILKLTIQPDGSFIYKQIGPVDRKRFVGTLIKDERTGEYNVLVGERSYKVITAAVTYHRGQVGNEVVILTPQDGESTYAAIENLMHHGAGEGMLPTGDAAELPSGDTAELPIGDAAELPAH